MEDGDLCHFLFNVLKKLNTMDSLFFWLSKLAWLFIAPDSVLIIIFVFGLIFMLKGKLRLAKSIFILLFVIFITIGFFPVGEWVLYPLEKQYPHNPKLENIDGIIVLGGAEDAVRSDLWKQPVVGSAAERFFAAIYLAKQYPEARMIYTSGSGSLVDQELKGADAARQLFVQQGLDVSKIIFERQSRNTWENAVLSKKLAKPEEGENWVLITTAWHMPRSMGIFCKVGWQVTPYPVDFVSIYNKLIRLDWNFSYHLNNLKFGMKEWIGLAAYQFTGKMCKRKSDQAY